MFRIDRSLIDYVIDLSHPGFKSSSELEAYQMKRAIVRISLLTFLIGSVVLGVSVLLIMIFLPGLFSVTFELLGEFIVYWTVNWPLVLIFFMALGVIIFAYLRS
jgi:hypothetical protein